MKKIGKGSYSIIFKLIINKKLEVGTLKTTFLSRGFYVYNGSAYGSGGLMSRIKHHVEKKKRRHWHMDYVTSSSKCKILKIIVCKKRNIERRISLEMLEEKDSFIGIPKFGATDDKVSKTHLFLIRANSEEEALKKVKKAYKEIGVKKIYTYLPSFFAIYTNRSANLLL
ncbi:MAG: GIY-YIG nuclease family protein [Candidatus Brockarchaeota archaeon]|nr:GIY-YIG nuclease family protein [Candidatus Brockarchaeota archaeon]MBO3768138.1 GIY-YIG nuclease family protein [Candidatus Brockarchaeota archaeon]MBO3801345.1 GIY-YIG nuclease family protein [Candidatus Brockarchaeota archaeon]